MEDLPAPTLSAGMVLVENRCSLISAGTERGTVKAGKASLLGKARQRPDLVKQVLQNVKKVGLKATLEKVRTKLDSLAALGYSSSGVVSASMDTNGMFREGDRVACAGAGYASHADIISVPQNLVVKIPDSVSFEEAAFTTLGAIAMQGVRQAEAKLGEKICVIGLGLLGQITCQLLEANGCSVFGIDLSAEMVNLANKTTQTKAFSRNDANLMKAIENFTNGRGFDSVIITAAASSNDPVELSAEISRKKGKIIMVGAVKMDLPREPHFFKKELDLRMSCSYGPGRYDSSYEENGQDYPYAYVRFTEQRNMEAFLDLIAAGKIDLKPLITHTFPVEQAEAAYALVLGEVNEFYIGIVLIYAEKKNTTRLIDISPLKREKINVAFIGAGSFAQSNLVPHVKTAGASLETVITSRGINARNAAEKLGFSQAGTEASMVLENENINTIFIATQHDSHASYVMDSIRAGKDVFVEKPLSMKEEDLDELIKVYSASGKSRVMVGFNRRFAPVSVALKSEFKGVSEPLVMNFRINAGFLPLDHWTQDAEKGGGRIVGEICHFIDLMQYFSGSDPIKVYASCIKTSNTAIRKEDNISITVDFADGSIGNLIYLANADSSVAKERIEISSGGVMGLIDDFREGYIFRNNKAQKLKLHGKGHKQEVEAFIHAISEGKDSPISFESAVLTTRTTFRIQDALHTGLPQRITLAHGQD